MKTIKNIMFPPLLIIAILMFIPMNVSGYHTFPMETLGEAISLEDGYLHISGVGLTDDSLDEVLLYIEGAEIFDLRTGFAINADKIYKGDTVRVVYVDYVALEIYVHAGDPVAADFMVVVSDNIWYSDDTCVFVTIDGKYRITVTEETLLTDGLGYGISWEDIEPGMEMFVWAAFLTASFPGQIIPDKIVLID